MQARTAPMGPRPDGRLPPCMGALHTSGSPMNSCRRRIIRGSLGVGALLSAGCMTKPMRPANPDGTYCFRIGKNPRPKLICTPSPIPSEQAEAVTKRFEPVPDRLTVYVIRNGWADVANLVRVTADAGSSVVTIPQSFVRLRMWPGSHTLVAIWDEGRTSIDVAGAAGEILFVELVGFVSAWGNTYRLQQADPTESRARVTRLRLVADVD